MTLAELATMRRIDELHLLYEARAGIDRYFGFYNAVRSHSALGARTPDQIYFDRPLLVAA